MKTKEEAEAIIKQLDGGADFQKLANEKTSDPSRQDQRRRSRLVRPGPDGAGVREGGLGARVGAYTKEPVQTQFGWHVIKVEDKRASSRRPSSRSRTRSSSVLLRDKYFALVKSLRGAAKVEVADPALKKAVDAMEAEQQ